MSGVAWAQVIGLANVDQLVAILRGFPKEEVDTHLTALLHGEASASRLRGPSIACTMRVVIAARRMPWGSPLGRTIWIVLGGLVIS